VSDHPRPPLRTAVDISDARVEDVLTLLRVAGLPWEDLEDAPLDLLAARGHDGTVVGCVGIGWYGSQALLRSLAVTPESRGAGVASALVSLAIERARALGASDIFGVTTTAEKFLSRFGFVPIERADAAGDIAVASELRCSCPEEALVMVLRSVGLSDGVGPDEDR